VNWTKYATETVAGIDLSLNSPAICIIPPTPNEDVVVKFSECHFHYLTNRKIAIINEQNIHGELMGSWNCDEERYESISEWVIRILKSYKCISTGLEGYAYGAANPSRLAQLCENQGLLKYHMFKEGIHYNLYPPSNIKKMATSNGRSTKDQMYDAWLKDTGVCLNSVFGRNPDGKIKSPISDIVDSFYIACSQRIDMIQTNYYFIEGEPNAKNIIRNDNKGNN
jgi:hypothetical protein